MNWKSLLPTFRIFPSSFSILSKRWLKLYLLDILALNETNHEGEVYTNHGIMKKTLYFIRTSLPNKSKRGESMQCFRTNLNKKFL